ncbi:MAG TPA: class I SAM-dependent methyltransferase [Gemmatimonadales bacterium]|jgi:SAM-dependent methyltransferase
MTTGQALEAASDRLKLAWFRARGSRPFTTGYAAYKEARVQETLDRGDFHLDRLPSGYGVGLDERIVEYPWLLAHLPRGPGVLLDAGSALNFRFLLRRPELAGKTVYICTLAPERHSFWQLGVSYTFQDLRRTCFREEFFDHVVSLSTLEHIGLDNGRFYTGRPESPRDPDSYIDAVREMARILRPGGQLSLSVPYGRRADLGWLQVFDAPMLDWVLEAFAPTAMVEQVFRYGSEGWQISDRQSAAQAGYIDLHSGSSWQRGMPVAAESVACLVLTK